MYSSARYAAGVSDLLAPSGSGAAHAAWSRVVLHADMDAFYAAVEQRDNPDLRGKPVIVGGASRRGVVTTASYEARPFGVGSAMPMAQAMRLCPQAVVVPPRFAHYSAVSKQVMEVFASFSPSVEPLSLDEAFLDMSGAEGIFGPPLEMGRKLKEAVYAATALRVSVGVANTKFVAKVASDFDKPDGLTVVHPSAVREFLDPLPVKRLWGVGPKTAPRLHALGMKTIGDVYDADPVWLAERLGSLGGHISRLAHNDDRREVTPGRREKSIGSERTLEEDIRGVDAIAPHLRAAADRIAATLRRRRLLAEGVRVKLKTRRFELHSRQRALARPTDNADAIFEVAVGLLPSFDLTEPMRLVGLAAFHLIDRDKPGQLELFASDEAAQAGRLDQAADRVAERFGEGLLQRGTRLGAHERPTLAEVQRARRAPEE